MLKNSRRLSVIVLKIRLTTVICILCSFYFSETFGCEYNVRDAGFVTILPTPYRIYCFIRNDTPEELTSTFKQISYTTFMDTNIEFEIINVEQNNDHPAMEYFHFWEIQSFPSAILVSPKGRSMVLPISFSKKSFKETVWSSLESAVSSPKREEILEHIVKAYSAVILIEGKDTVKNKRVHDAVDAASRKIAGMMSQLPKHIDEPPHIIVIPQELIFQERILLWSLNVNESEVNEPCVAVLYGRGRRIGPLLKGEQITESVLFNILFVIGLSCDCGLDARWTRGTLIPHKWGEKMQSDVVKYLGFDAESPMVKMEISSIMSINRSIRMEDNGNIGSSRDELNEYREDVLEYENGSAIGRVSPAQLRELSSTGSATPKSGLNFKMILTITSIIVLLIFVGGLFILLKSRRRIS